MSSLGRGSLLLMYGYAALGRRAGETTAQTSSGSVCVRSLRQLGCWRVLNACVDISPAQTGAGDVSACTLFLTGQPKVWRLLQMVKKHPPNKTQGESLWKRVRLPLLRCLLCPSLSPCLHGPGGDGTAVLCRSPEESPGTQPPWGLRPVHCSGLPLALQTDCELTSSCSSAFPWSALLKLRQAPPLGKRGQPFLQYLFV